MAGIINPWGGVYQGAISTIPNKNMSGWAAAAQAASSLGGQLIANAGNARQNRKNRQHAERMMNIQHIKQRELNQQGHDLSLDLWNKTNAAAQLKHYKDAGLNAGLMYEGGGVGGSTANSSGGSAAMGATPSSIPMQPMDIGAALQSAAQIKLMNAQAKKAEAEASSIKGEEGTIGKSQINKLMEETASEQLKQALLKAQKITETQRSGLVMQEAIKTAEEVVKISRENHVGEETIEAVISEIKAKSAGVDIVNDLNRSRIKLTETQDKQLEEAIAQKWAEIDLHDTEVNIKIAQTIINGITGIGGLIQAGRLAEAMRKGKQATEKAWGEGFKDGVEQMKR